MAYDLVIIGGSSAGLYAAVVSARLKARVALVEQHQLGEGRFLFHKALNEAGRTYQPMTARNVDLSRERVGEGTAYIQAVRWAEAVVADLIERDPQSGSSALLAALGIEVIVGTGRFQNHPLAFAVDGRQLRARAYLIATGAYTAKPSIAGLETTGYLTCEEIFSQRQRQPRLPQNLLVIGGGLAATELSQTFNRFGCNVTMVVAGPGILAGEDAEATRLIQAQLEAEGVRILTHSQVTEVKRLNSKKWVQVDTQGLEVDEILLASGQRPRVEFLNLEPVGVEVSPQGICVNDKLQTSHPQIYACGEVIGGYPLPHVANYEAQIALKNALFWPTFPVNYRAIPWAVFSDPELARVGLTEAQAKRRYGPQVQVLRTFYKDNGRSQMRGETTGFCKIIVKRNGTILGAHLVGSAAAELVHAIALAMQQRLKIKALAELVHISPTFAEVTGKTAAEWELQRLQNSFWQDLLEGTFNLRRSWHR